MANEFLRALAIPRTCAITPNWAVTLYGTYNTYVVVASVTEKKKKASTGHSNP